MGAKIVGLSTGEKELLDAYIRYEGNLTKTANALGISISLASARKGRALTKYLRAKEIIKEYESYKMQAPSILGA